MTASPDVVKAAIEELVGDLQARVDLQKELEAEITEAQEGLQKIAETTVYNHPLIPEAKEWEDLPDDVTPEQLAVVMAYFSLNPTAEAQFEDIDMAEKVQEAIQSFAEAQDMDAIEKFNTTAAELLTPYNTAVQEINYKARELQTFAVHESIVFETQVVPPEKEGGEWTVVTTPLQISEDGEVSVPETLPDDFVIGGYISDPTTPLSAEFNVASFAVPAGQKIEPFVLTAKDGGDARAPKYFERIGHWNHSAGTSVPHIHPLTQSIPLVRPQPQMMMVSPEQLMAMLGGGGGPTGPGGPGPR